MKIPNSGDYRPRLTSMGNIDRIPREHSPLPLEDTFERATARLIGSLPLVGGVVNRNLGRSIDACLGYKNSLPSPRSGVVSNLLGTAAVVAGVAMGGPLAIFLGVGCLMLSGAIAGNSADGFQTYGGRLAC